MIMALQYIFDSSGKKTGVFIPIKEWEALKNKFKEPNSDDLHVPDFHKKVVNDRLEKYENDREALDFDKVMDDIEKDL